MLDVGCFLRPFLHSAFFLLHSLRDGGLPRFSRFRVRGSRFKVQFWICGQFAQPADDFRALPAFGAAVRLRHEKTRVN